MHWSKNYWFILMLVSNTCFAKAQPKVPVVDPQVASVSKLQLLNFRFQGLAAFDSGTNSNYTAMLSWNPNYQWNEKWGIGLDFDYSLFLKTSKSYFSVLSYSVRGSYQWCPQWSSDIRLGGQSWLDSPSSTRVLSGVNLQYKFLVPVLKFFDSLNLGYDAVFRNPLIHQIHAGVGIRF
jgi:hypothetical protein